MRRGLTIVEVLIVIGLSIGILFVLARFATFAVLMKDLISQKLQVTQEIEQALQVMVTDIRSMGQSGGGAYPLESVATGSVVFFSDIDVDGGVERVRYSIASSTIVKGVIEPAGNPPVYPTSTEIVSTAIASVLGASSSIAYYDAVYTGTSTAPLASPIDPLLVRVIRFTIVSDVSATSSPQARIFEFVITPRNLRIN